MNNNFDELTKRLAQSVTHRGALKKFGLGLAGLALASLLAVPAAANDFKRGPLMSLSDSDVLHVCPDEFAGSSRIEHESSIVVNPRNPKNIAVAWSEGGFRAIGSAVSFDGGKHWEQKLVPRMTLCSGGSFRGIGDPWPSFGPDGGLHLICFATDTAGRQAVLANKSLDGGVNWLGPVMLWDTTDKRLYPDYPRIAADSTDARLVYGIWCNLDSGNRGGAILSRSTDGGMTWEPPRVIYDSGRADHDARPAGRPSHETKYES